MIANLLNPFSMGLRAGRPAKTIFWQFQSRSTIRYLLQSWEIGTVLQPVAWNTNELAFVSMVPEIRPVDTESISVSLEGVSASIAGGAEIDGIKTCSGFRHRLLSGVGHRSYVGH
jgi:hypothetical protein